MPRALKPPSPERAVAEKAVEEALANRDFLRAAATVAQYEARQPVPRGINIDWINYSPDYDVRTLAEIYGYVPRILQGINSEAVAPLRFSAAMQCLWGQQKRRWLPIDLPTGTHLRADAAARMFLFYARKKTQLAEMEGPNAYGRPVATRVSVVGDSRTCDACRALAGRRFLPGAPPEIPYPACTCALGCRCMLSTAS